MRKRERSCIEIQVSPQEKEIIQKYADKLGVSMSMFVKKSIERYLGILEIKTKIDEETKEK